MPTSIAYVVGVIVTACYTACYTNPERPPTTTADDRDRLHGKMVGVFLLSVLWPLFAVVILTVDTDDRVKAQLYGPRGAA